MAHTPGSGWRVTLRLRDGSLKEQTGRSREDTVVRNERNAEVDGRCGIPTVGILFGLRECVPGSPAGHSENDVGAQHGRTGPDHFGPSWPALPTVETFGTPATASSAETHLGDGLERDQVRTAGKQWTVELDEGSCAPEQVGAEDVWCRGQPR